MKIRGGGGAVGEGGGGQGKRFSNSGGNFLFSYFCLFFP